MYKIYLLSMTLLALLITLQKYSKFSKKKSRRDMPVCLVPGCGQEHTRVQAQGLGLRLCARCGKVAYCSKACQARAWKNGHKSACQAPAPSLTLDDYRVLDRVRVLFETKHFPAVANMTDEVLAILEAEHSLWPSILGETYNRLGYSLLLASNYKKALEVLLKAKPRLLQAQDTKGFGDVCNSLGACYTQLGRYEEALVQYEKAQSLAVDLGEKCGQASCANNIGLTLVELKRFAEARVALDRCWNLSVELGSRSSQARACARLGSLFLKQGRGLDGIDCLRKAHRVFKDLDLGGDMASAGALLGKALIDNRDLFARRTDEIQLLAGEYLEVARRVSARNTLFPSLLAALMHLARLAAWKGNEDEAVKQLEAHLDVWVHEAGPVCCAGCMQRRGTETPMLVCAGCRVVRFFCVVFAMVDLAWFFG